MGFWPMGSDQSSRCEEVVKYEDKEARLDQFLGFYLDRLFADWDDRPEQHHITIVARSPASPVARAIIVNADDIRGGGIQVRALFSDLEPSDALSEWFDLALACRDCDDASPIDIRYTANPALIDAHEQMVLGSEMSWCGDAMRRDPSRRDTIEIFDPCCPATAGQNSRSFEALWTRSQQIKIDRKRSKQEAAKHASNDQVDLNATPSGPSLQGATASTRH